MAIPGQMAGRDMKRITIVLILLSLVSCQECLAGPGYVGQQMSILGMMAAAGGTPAPTYLASESFDPAGYDLSWTETGTPDEDYTTSPAPLEGTQSIYLPGCSAATDQKAYVAFTVTAGQPQEFYWLINFTALDMTSQKTLAVASTTGNARATINISSTGQLCATAFGGTTVCTVTTMAEATTYHVWGRYLPGTGADAFASTAFSTDGVRPTSGNNYAESTNGTVTVNTNRLELWGDYGTGTNCISAIFDKVRVDDATITDNPS